MATWVRESFDSHGLTQHAAGPHLAKIQELASGWVVLCIDVSGSMWGSPIRQACDGARRFLADAAQNGYRVALLEWHHGVSGYYGFNTGLVELDRILMTGLHASGGNDIVPTLELCERELGTYRGDRVVAIFGDGDLGNASSAQTKAADLHSNGIRILTLGLGEGAATALNVISSERLDAPRVVDSGELANGIAALAKVLKRSST
ncbi:vWA domain-containing protein [Mycobacterium sp. NPDC050041]|uniref:vWA domain-containing protein n=1 Tax=Mycobacterium sp. NPDC050041 TaxID=3364293 RepID=UPI003C2DDF6C